MTPTTFAKPIILSHGVPIEYFSKMRGYSQLKTTEYHAKILYFKLFLTYRIFEFHPKIGMKI